MLEQIFILTQAFPALMGTILWILQVWLVWIIIFPACLVLSGGLDLVIICIITTNITILHPVMTIRTILGILTFSPGKYTSVVKELTKGLLSSKSRLLIDIGLLLEKTEEEIKENSGLIRNILIILLMRWMMKRSMHILNACLISAILATMAYMPIVKLVERMSPWQRRNRTLGFIYYTMRYVIKFDIIKILVDYAPPVWDKGYRLLIALKIIKILIKLELIVPADAPKTKRRKGNTFATQFQYIAKVINDFDLPSYIRNGFEDRLSTHDTLELLKELNYPTDVNFEAREPIVSTKDTIPWYVASTTWRHHLPILRDYIQDEFEEFRKAMNVPLFRHSYAFGTLDTQLASISRYFYHGRTDLKLTDDDVTIVWDIVKDIYENSKIAPLHVIYKQWNKRFNVGVFADSVKKTDARGGRKKMPRWEYIQRMGGASGVIRQWKEFFAHFPRMENFAQFFTKAEYLPEKKVKSKRVRTPVASMLPQYLSQMTWSAYQNHRFRPFSTPVKVGLPINGFNMSKLFHAHASLNGQDGARHYAGDCTNFDSTITGGLLDLVKAIRKKGFEGHKQYKALAWLIDRNYEAIANSKIVSSNTGDMYEKGSGLMTGHASTSADNSLVMVGMYALAWRRLTNLNAASFLKHNVLSVYGDDHVLSISKAAPQTWTWDNIVKIMAQNNIILREEVETKGKGASLEQIPFLSKFAKRPSQRDVDELTKAGINIPEFIIYHDPLKLVGKLTAKLTNKNPLARAKRIQSYMYLTPHNAEAYDVCAQALHMIFERYPKVKIAVGAYTPTYEKVLRVHYNPESQEKHLDEEFDPEDENFLSIYGAPTIFDNLLAGLSVLPDYFNPIYRNSGWSMSFQALFGEALAWPNKLLATQNGIRSDSQLADTMRKTTYDFLVDRSYKGLLISSQVSDCMLRHWLYCLIRPPNERKWLGILDSLSGKIANWNFLLFAKTTDQIERVQLAFLNVLTIWLLNFVKSPYDFAPYVVVPWRIPDVVDKLLKFTEWLWAKIWVRVPVAFRNLHAIEASQDKWWLITALTGIGKSTTMINFIRMMKMSRKVIVIVPRRNLVIGLTKYMNEKFGPFFSGLTMNVKLDKRREVWYMTPQEYMINRNVFETVDHVLIVDEAHVDELPYKVIKGYLRKEGSAAKKIIFTTATPENLKTEFNMSEINFPAPRVYSIRDRVVQVIAEKNTIAQAYARAVVSIFSAYNYLGRTLIFVDSLEEATVLQRNVPYESIIFTGKDTPPSKWGKVIIATSAVDVGITIEGLYMVITKDIMYKGTKTVEYVCDDTHCGAKMTMRDRQYYKISDSLLTQRRGRTGRTNNGIFIKITFDEKALQIRPVPEQTPISMLKEWMDTGLPMSDILLSGIVDLKIILSKMFALDLNSKEVEQFTKILELYRTTFTWTSEEEQTISPNFTGTMRSITFPLFQTNLFEDRKAMVSEQVIMSLIDWYDKNEEFDTLYRVTKALFKADRKMNRAVQHSAAVWAYIEANSYKVVSKQSDFPFSSIEEYIDSKEYRLNAKKREETEPDDTLMPANQDLDTRMRQLFDKILGATCGHGVNYVNNDYFQRVCLRCEMVKVNMEDMAEVQYKTPYVTQHLNHIPLANGFIWVKKGIPPPGLPQPSAYGHPLYENLI